MLPQALRRHSQLTSGKTPPSCIWNNAQTTAYIPSRSAPLEPKAAEKQLPGRFEQDFVEDDVVGSGELGMVMKVRYKNGREGEVFVLKKSKGFEL
jgi:mitosis inhibitor protein kinase SWE1